MKSAMDPVSRRMLKGSLFLVVLLALCCGAITESAAITEEQIRDAVLGKTPVDLGTMDLNKDGKVDVADVVVIHRGSGMIETPISNMTEGIGSVIVRVNFTFPISGTLSFNVSGTATEGVDYQLPNKSVTVNGSSVDIPLTIIDDAIVEEKVETIVFSFYGDALGYIPAGYIDRTIYIYDNDSVWDGTIEIGVTALHFQMKIIQSATGTAASLMTDGNGIIPMNGTSNEWPATGVSLSGTSFGATVASISIPSSLTNTGVTMERKFVFQADTQQAGHVVEPESEIRGVVTEYLTSSATYLNRQTVGTFVLLRQVPEIETVNPPLESVP